MTRHFRSGVPESKIPRRFLEAIPRERGGVYKNSSPALSDVEGSLYELLQETVAFILSTCIRVEKLTPHLYYFSMAAVILAKASLCLRASSLVFQAGGKVFPSRGVATI